MWGDGLWGGPNVPTASLVTPNVPTAPMVSSVHARLRSLQVSASSTPQQGVLGERVPAFLGQISLLLALGSCSPWLTDHSSLPPSALPRWQHRRCSEHPLSHPDLAAISSLTRKMTLLVVLPPTNPTCAGRELPDPWEALGTSCCELLKRETLCRSSMWCWPHNDSAGVGSCGAHCAAHSWPCPASSQPSASASPVGII